jgi:ribosomal protein S18 acetylase RimI-like enzyme
MQPRLTIRSATADDEAAIAALWQACGLVTSYNDPAKDFRFARDKSNSDVLVGIHEDGNLVGSVMVGHDGHRGWIYYVAADPNYRKQGIGRRMTEPQRNGSKAAKS